MAATKTSVRTFARALKAAAPQTQDELAIFMAPYIQTPSRTVARTLIEYTLAAIKQDASLHVLRELLGAVNTTLKKVASSGVVSNAFVEIRAATRDKHGQDSLMYAAAKTRLVDDKKYHDAVRQAAAVAVAAGTAAPKIVTWHILKAIVEATRQSDNISDMLVFMMLCSGARRGEILERSTFEALPGGMLRQSGIEKSKKLMSVTKEVLYTTPEDFMKRFAKFRAVIGGREIGTINTGIQRRMKEISAMSGVPLVSHDMRRMYAVVSYAVYHKQETFISWVATRLGHEGLGSAQYYMTVAVPMSAEDIADARNMVAAQIEQDAKDGKEVAQDAGPVIPRNIKKRDGKAMERLNATVAALDAAGMRYTQRTLKEYGYSSKTASEWFAMKAAGA